MMKKVLSAKNIFLKIFLPICAAAILSTCDLFQESPKDFLEDYASIATVASREIRPNDKLIPQGAWLNVGSDDDITITYIVDNPGNHRLRAAIEFPTPNVKAVAEIDFPENDGLLRSWIEETIDGDGNVTRTTRTENETNFLKSTFSIKIPAASLANIDGKISQFDISPTVTLYRADFGEEKRMQSFHTIHLRCNSPPGSIEDAVGQMIVTGDVQKLVLAIKLPALKTDDKYLTVSENGRTHVFDAHFANDDASSGWTISSTAPQGMVKTDADEAPPVGANCFIATDINIKNRSPFLITLTLADEGGLSSSRTFNSHGRKCLPPEPTSTLTTLAQSESDGMATYTLKTAESGATIHYTVKKSGGAENYSGGSGVSPLAIKLPAGTFDISAYATKPDFVDSEKFEENITVTPSVFFVSASGNDTSGDGSKSKPFATIAHAATSLNSLVPPPIAPESATIFLLSDLAITDNHTITLSPANGTTLNLRGCKDGSAGSRVTVSFKFSQGNISSAFVIEGAVQMQDLTIKQTQDSTVINDGIAIRSGSTLSLKNVSVTEMKTRIGAVNLEGNRLNILGGVNITGNTTADGAPKNVYLPAGKTLAVQQGSLEGTKIGVSTQADPATAPVPITSGYSAAGYRNAQLSSYFTSDAGFALKLESGEAALAASGGSIGIVAPKEITFSLDATSGNGNAITVSAFADGDPLDFAGFTTFAGEVWFGSVPTGKRFTTNSFSLDSSWDGGMYVIKITAIYGGTAFNGELYYTKTP
ncbi:MAG: hypothetical protein K2I95_02755 [Treponemataceae bacterium]|nr:hypothetical protein [Treponemataceae bacterium]